MTRKFWPIDQESTHPNSVNAKLALLFTEELPSIKKMLSQINDRLEWIESQMQKQNGFERWKE